MLKNSLLIALLALALSGCGYTMSRSSQESAPAAAGHKVYVPMFANDTFEPLVEADVTAALKDELALDGRWTITDSADADLLVTGRVKTVDQQPLSYDKQERILEYRVRLEVDVKVTDVRTQKVLWKDAAMESSSAYRVTEDVTKGKISKGEAIKKASKGFAEEFVIKALDIF